MPKFIKYLYECGCGFQKLSSSMKYRHLCLACGKSMKKIREGFNLEAKTKVKPFAYNWVCKCGNKKTLTRPSRGVRCNKCGEGMEKKK